MSGCFSPRAQLARATDARARGHAGVHVSATSAARLTGAGCADRRGGAAPASTAPVAGGTRGRTGARK